MSLLSVKSASDVAVVGGLALPVHPSQGARLCVCQLNGLRNVLQLDTRSLLPAQRELLTKRASSACTSGPNTLPSRKNRRATNAIPAEPSI